MNTNIVFDFRELMMAKYIFIFVLHVLHYVSNVEGTGSMMSACTERLKHIPGHTACLPVSEKLVSSGVSDEDKILITKEHNKYRKTVDPPAANMLKLYWDDELAQIAQSWACNCKVEHDPMAKRNIPGVYQLGQNIANDYRNWTEVVSAWNSEVSRFNYNGSNDVTHTGHYTQVVWADTTKIGCGFAKCNKTLFYVCDYAPTGNRGGNSIPYQKGQPKCKKTDGDLCDCAGKTCRNGGIMHRDTCECECFVPDVYMKGVCKLDCERDFKEPWYCNKAPYLPENCHVYADAPDRCPIMCNMCPYGDYRYDINGSKAYATTTPTTAAPSRPSPKHCKDKYRMREGHTACLQPSDKLNISAELNVTSSDIDLIVNLHNSIRKNVVPLPANMIKLTWDPEVAMVAQVWIESCQMKADDPSKRQIPGRFSLGQNIAVGSKNWEEAINGWKKSGIDFVYGQKSSKDVSMYTQLIWADTTRVGCGYAVCGNTPFYVCNYGPSGNDLQDNNKPYINGTTCSSCVHHCTNQMCDCEDVTCENGGILDPATCTCACKTKFHKTPSCTLSCQEVNEASFCKSHVFTEEACAEFLVQTFCPNTCNVCPYTDSNYIDQGVTPPPSTPPATQRPLGKGCHISVATSIKIHTLFVLLDILVIMYLGV